MEDCSQFIMCGIRPALELYTKPAPKAIIVPEEFQRTPEWRGLKQLFEWCTELIPDNRPNIIQVLQVLKQIEEKKESEWDFLHLKNTEQHQEVVKGGEGKLTIIKLHTFRSSFRVCQ